jgi:hypothetical protein
MENRTPYGRSLLSKENNSTFSSGLITYYKDLGIYLNNIGYKRLPKKSYFS